MATMLCKCGTTLRDDNPDDGLLMFSRREFDIDADSALLRGRATELWRCWTCGRLWVFWDKLGDPTEYIAVE
jgi:hypothetical protein